MTDEQFIRALACAALLARTGDIFGSVDHYAYQISVAAGLIQSGPRQEIGRGPADTISERLRAGDFITSGHRGGGLRGPSNREGTPQ